jgi:hypothetical protein
MSVSQAQEKIHAGDFGLTWSKNFFWNRTRPPSVNSSSSVGGICRKAGPKRAIFDCGSVTDLSPAGEFLCEQLTCLGLEPCA